MAKVDKDHMTTLRTAAESKTTADTALDDTQVEAVAYAINSAANCGEYKVTFQEVLRENVKTQLDGKGYDLKTASQLDRGTIISWK